MKTNIALSLILMLALNGCDTIVDTNTSSVLDTNITNPVKTVQQNPSINYASKVALGKAFFSDTSLSATRSESCATCHNPDEAFIDNRKSAFIGASLGDDNITYADRNAPMVTYASFIPAFSVDTNTNRVGTHYKGGLFWDGRASDLVEQAKGPFLNDVEMQMPDEASVIARVVENSNYVNAMRNFYGEEIFDSDMNAFNAVADAIASFEKSDSLSTFDSKYDKYISGIVELSAQEKEGERLFIDSNCIVCHNHKPTKARPAMFTFFGYQNIGVPKNGELRSTNAKDSTFIDHGLLDNPTISGRRQDGRFKVPSLRNVAVTPPYTHNGKFKSLETMVHFYNTRDVEDALNPETNQPWQESEVLANRFKNIGNLKLTTAQENAIVAFLKTLTDERYEHLLN